jgi:hypothetical protein
LGRHAQGDNHVQAVALLRSVQPYQGAEESSVDGAMLA